MSGTAFAPDARAARAECARVVEIVGPAGAGKSTLAGTLPSCDPRMAPHTGVWRLPRRDLLAAAARLLPTALAAALGGAPLKPAEIAQMMRIDALRRVLARARAAEGPGRVLVMDEGPVFAFSWLDVFYGRNGDPGWATWRRRALEAWAGALDGVIRLDADDAVLARRINERAKEHMVKGLPPQDIAEFTARFRRAFDRVLGELVPAGVAVVGLRTDDGAPEERAAELHHAIQEAIGEH